MTLSGMTSSKKTGNDSTAGQVFIITPPSLPKNSIVCVNLPMFHITSAHATSGDFSSQPSFTLSFFRIPRLRRHETILKRARRLQPVTDNTSSCGD
jgi:hypothetical protein